MKVALKEWARCPRGLANAVVYVLTNMAYIIINTWILQQVAVTVEHSDQLGKYMMPLIGACIGNAILGIITNSTRKHAVWLIFNGTNKRFSEKTAKIPYGNFVQIPADKVATIAANLSNIVTTPFVLTNGIMDVVTILSIMIAIYQIDGTIIAPIVVMYSLSLFAIRCCLVKYNMADRERTAAVTSRNKEQAELVNGFAEVRSFSRELSHINTISKLDGAIMKASDKKLRVAEVLNTMFNTIDTLGLVLVLMYVAKGIAVGNMTPAIGVTLVMYVWRLSGPLDELSGLADVYSERSVYASQFKEFMEIPDEEDGTVELVDFNEEIEIDNVSFGYNDTNNVLTNVNLTIKKGERVGICGTSGGGKSTLLKLIPALYREFDGKIRIDGVDVRKLRKASVRSKIGFVHQDNFIFNTTIYENILYGRPDATKDEVIDACKKASLYEFICSLPEGFDTNVGPKGLKLSGGQRQRISLARIFLKDADIILLDEATSALDNESESVIQESLGMFEGKTIITVAHRLSTIRDCDKIVVIDNHRVAEVGTHEELLRKGGIYAGLHR